MLIGGFPMRHAGALVPILLVLFLPASAQPQEGSGRIAGTIAINAEFSPYEEAPTTADQYPKTFRRGSAKLFVPAEILQAAVESVKRLIGNQRKPLDPFSSEMVNRLFLRGAVVIDKVRSKYRISAQRSAEMDLVFEPDEPFTKNRIVERERVDRFLKVIYPSPEASSQEKTNALTAVFIAADLLPIDLGDSDESEQYQEQIRISRYLLLRRLDPVIDLKLRNKGNVPIAIDKVGFQTTASKYLNDYNFTGLVPIPNTTAVIILGKEKSTTSLSDATLQPGQELTLRITLQSKTEYAYYGSIVLWSAGKEVYRTPAFSLAFLT